VTATTPEAKVNLREDIVHYHDGDTELAGLLVCDDHDDERPGIVVVHGGAGLDIKHEAVRGN
jgi:predicted alpha/beta-fold hydrolase